MNINAVLVRTENALNVGAAARALANMGGGRLILIDPRCELDSRANCMAAGAQDQMKSMVVYANWDAFYAVEGDGLRIAMTRRMARTVKLSPLSEQFQSLKGHSFPSLYLIFGPEADGLNAEDLSNANFACNLPVFGDFASYNLAQAVLLAFFIVRTHFPPEAMPQQTKDANDPAVQPFYFPDQLIKDWLTAMGFDLNARRSSAYITLKRLFLQNLPSRHEIQVLEAVLQQNIRKLRSLRLGTKELTDDGRNISV